MKLKNQIKKLNRVNNNICLLNSFNTDKLKELEEQSFFLENEEKRIINRFYVMRRFLTTKNYKDVDFQEYLNSQLSDSEIDIEMKRKIKFYFSQFLKGKN